MSRLGKRHVEELLAAYDRDPVAALTVALRRALDLPDATWNELLAAAPVPAERRARLERGDVDALDELLVELNELRSVRPATTSP